MKQQILAAICSKLSALGIPVQNGKGADITINTEFLDAGWSTGSKKISYEASVFANAQDKVLYMYEKTTEIGHGLSFGGGSGSSFQSGTTLFRKVKSIQYGPDGKAYEYSLDLGAIPKTVKETAKQYGWKFKTVLSKSKAMYPAGYVPTTMPPIMNQTSQHLQPRASGFCSNCGMQLLEGAKNCDKCGKPADITPQQPLDASPAVPVQQSQFQQQTLPGSDKPVSQKKAGTLGLIGFILLGIAAIIFLATGKASAAGWLVSLTTLAAGLVLQRKLAKKGCLLSLVLWVIVAVILFFAVGLTITPGQ